LVGLLFIVRSLGNLPQPNRNASNNFCYQCRYYY